MFSLAVESVLVSPIFLSLQKAGTDRAELKTVLFKVAHVFHPYFMKLWQQKTSDMLQIIQKISIKSEQALTSALHLPMDRIISLI